MLPELSNKWMNKKSISITSLFLIFFMFPGCHMGGQPSNPKNPPQTNNVSQTPSVFVHLFEWKWSDVALECEQFLGPKGYSAVQISPPNEHIDHKSISLADSEFPWWARYQPVSYKLISRSGGQKSFIDMVQRCNNAGVNVYADTVINHMAELTGVGVAGTPFDLQSKEYSVFSQQDFHDFCQINNEDYLSSEDPTINAQRAENIRTCQLGGLPDLNTGKESVRNKIIAYIEKMANLGVSGFRIDAAKHMHPEDIDYIIKALNTNLYFFQEVIDTGGQPVKSSEYAKISDVTELNYLHEISSIFAKGQLGELRTLGFDDRYLDSSKAVVFIDNHDSQRGHGAPVDFSHRQGKLYELANIFMLAWPYGYPKVMSSYEWGGINDSKGPPHDGQGNTLNVHNNDGSVNCFDGLWICEHRFPKIANMVLFRNLTKHYNADQVENWWENGGDQIAFSLNNESGSVGFLAINRGNDTQAAKIQTGFPPGQYCNLLHNAFDSLDKDCTSGAITVDDQGFTNLQIPRMDGVAISRNIAAKTN